MEMHHSPQSPSMTMRQASVDFGGFSSVSPPQNPGTELWGKKPRGIDWGPQGSTEMREHFEHRRPAIQERGQNNWNTEAQYSMVEQQHNIQARSIQDHQKENKEMAAFIASLLQTQQQQQQHMRPAPPQFHPQQQQQFNHHQQQMLRSIRPPSMMGNQSMTSPPRIPAAVGGDFYHQKQREMALPRSVEFLNNLSAAAQQQATSHELNWAKLKEQQMSVAAAAHHQHVIQRSPVLPPAVDNNNGGGYPQQFQPPPPNDVNKMIDLEKILQLQQKFKQQQANMTTSDSMKQGTTGLMVNSKTTYNNNPLMQPPPPQQQQQNSSQQVSDLDVDELRKQLISGELVVVRKNDLMKATAAMASDQVVASKDNQQQQQIGVQQQQQCNVNNEQGNSTEEESPPPSHHRRRLSSEDNNVFHGTAAYKTPASRQQSSESSSSVERRLPTTFYKSPGRRSRSDEDPDWRNRDDKTTTPVARKPSFESQYRRKKSAADDDQDWRRRDSDEHQVITKSPEQESRKQQSEAAAAAGVLQTEYEVEVVQYAKPKTEAAAATKSSKQTSPQVDTKKMEARKVETTSTESTPRQKHHVASSQRNPKLEIQNWIGTTDNKKNKQLQQRQQPLDDIMKSLTIVEGNIDDAQLGAFMEKIQLGATSEEKLRSYADDLCNRAIEHPSFGYGASLLCHRMSWMMVEHGTKFRSMVFSNMEKQYKCRETLFKESFIVGNIRWFGLIHFLAHLYLNVRVPDTNKRFAVLVKPVYNCLLQVLRSGRVTANQVKCFGEMFHLCGMSLEEDESEMMTTLMSEIRDSSLTSQDPGIRNIYLRCVRTYATRWQE